MKYLRVKNWEDFQHYKDRSPPWIKLHRDLLRDYDFLCLQDASKLHLMLIWLLASQLDNKIPADQEYIKKQIGVKGDIDFNELILNGFLIDDSKTLAECKQVAIVETEAETEAERELGQKENSLQTSPTSSSSPAPKEYFFKGANYRIDIKQSEIWLEKFRGYNQQSLLAKLETIDGYYSGVDKKPKNVFFSVSTWVERDQPQSGIARPNLDSNGEEIVLW